MGVVEADGRLRFRPILLDAAKLLSVSAPFSYYDVSGARRDIELPPGTLGFTYCNVPIVHRRSATGRIAVIEEAGELSIAGLELDYERSQSIFRREGRVLRLDVYLRPVIA